MANVFDTDENELIKADKRHLENIQWVNQNDVLGRIKER